MSEMLISLSLFGEFREVHLEGDLSGYATFFFKLPAKAFYSAHSVLDGCMEVGI